MNVDCKYMVTPTLIHLLCMIQLIQAVVPSKNVNTKADNRSAVFAVSPLPPNNVLCRGNADSFLD